MSTRINEWLGRESKTFSTLCGERFTHKEVLVMHAYVLAVLVIIGKGGALG